MQPATLSRRISFSLNAPISSARRRTKASSARPAIPTSPIRLPSPISWPQWHLDAQALTAALLHDVMEDTAVTKSEIAERFGKHVADLVDGVSKLDRIEFQTQEEAQAENFRKMLLAMARDVRVILIKLADRLHNMRTLTVDAREEARAHRARDARDLRADRPPAGTERALPGTARSLLSVTSIRIASMCCQRHCCARAATGARSWTRFWTRSSRSWRITISTPP